MPVQQITKTPTTRTPDLWKQPCWSLVGPLTSGNSQARNGGRYWPSHVAHRLQQLQLLATAASEAQGSEHLEDPEGPVWLNQGIYL